MPRPKRADEAHCLYHALNRGNAKSVIFKKDADFHAFERILAEGLERYPCQILAYQLMSNHWHFVLRPTEDGGMSNFLRWVTLTHTQRYHAHYGTSGEGHVYQGRSKMTRIFLWLHVMSSAMPCVPTWSIVPNSGVGDRSSGGSPSRNRTLDYLPHGRLRVCLTGLTV